MKRAGEMVTKPEYVIILPFIIIPEKGGEESRILRIQRTHTKG
jgi:hypothetical protein